MKEPSTSPPPFSESRSNRQHLRSCQHSKSLQPWLCLLNAGAGLPAAPGQAGAANNAARKAAVLAQHFVANDATAGVGAPIVSDEANAAATRCPCCIDNIEVIDRINCAILQQSMAMIGEAIWARGAVAVAAGGTGRVAAADGKLELLHKRCKLAIKEAISC
jgi:hypothetical protein